MKSAFSFLLALFATAFALPAISNYRPSAAAEPMLYVEADAYEVWAGTPVVLRAVLADADGAPVEADLVWWCSQGSIASDGATATLDTSEASGDVEVTASVAADDAARAVGASTTIRVRECTVVLATVKLADLTFARSAVRLSGASKAALDDVSLRLMQDPTLCIVVDGHGTDDELAGVSRGRAEAARDYLVDERGIDPERITVRDFGPGCPPAAGAPEHRAELFLLPNGMSPDELPKDCSGNPRTPEALR
jgi:outer membrane protein OmpA-like peptidoglycan-associated protein